MSVKPTHHSYQPEIEKIGILSKSRLSLTIYEQKMGYFLPHFSLLHHATNAKFKKSVRNENLPRLKQYNLNIEGGPHDEIFKNLSTFNRTLCHKPINFGSRKKHTHTKYGAKEHD